MNDLDAQAEHLFDPVLAPALVPCIHPQLRKARKALSYTLQQQSDPVLIGDLGTVDLGFENQPFRIYKQVSLASANLLAAVVTPCFATDPARLG